MRRTKILATLGPASAASRVVRELLEAGADGFRINCSHGDSASHRALIATVRGEAARAARPIFVVADLQGPKLRLGELSGSPLVVRAGSSWLLDDRSEAGDLRRAPAEVPNLRGSAKPGDPILLGDGDVELRVETVGREGVLTRVIAGGPVSSRAGIFLPGAHLRTSILSAKDRDDLRMALEEGVDYIALSFVRSASDVRAAQRFARSLGSPSRPGWIAKIERGEALREIGGILESVDAIMVARGDLGIEVPLERLALEQKRLVALARRAGIPSIVATQMLLSMVHATRPTRAEATDVANAVLDGADCLMLSEESAVGEHPVSAVAWLRRIAEATEPAAPSPPPEEPASRESDDRAVARAALSLAESRSARMIVTPTHSGRTARWVASGRPRTPIVAISTHADVRRRLGLVWGVVPHDVPDRLSLTDLREFAARQLRDVVPGESTGPIVVTAGYPLEGRPTNLVTLVEVPSRRGGRRRKRPGPPARAP